MRTDARGKAQPWGVSRSASRGLLVALAFAGCGISEPLGTPTGALRVFVRSTDGGEYVGSPEATFFAGTLSGFPNSRAASDTCLLASLTTSTTLNPLNNLDAGDSIAFTTGGGTEYLYPATDLAGSTSYISSTGFIPITPGAAVTFQVPGAVNGFPAATLTSLTAPAITSLSPVSGAPPLDQPLAVTWAPAGDDSSRFEIALKYATEDATMVNRHVLCDWRDDGSGQIAASLLGGWAAATIRRIEVSRYRTLEQQLPGGALFFIATFDTLPPVAP